MSRQKLFAVLAVVVLGAGIFLTARLIRNPPAPEVAAPKKEGRLVRTILLKRQKKTFWVSGYGTVRPKTELNIVSEVAGRIVRRSPGFRTGGFIRKGDLLFEIDPKDYELAVIQRRAQIAQLRADITRLLQEEKNLKADLAIAERHLRVVRKELERNSKLRRQGVISAGQLDVTRQNFLRQERAALSTRNSLNLIPSQLAQKRAALSVTRAQLSEALLNLKRTKFIAPFDARVRKTKLEIGYYVRAAESLGTIYDVSAVEVPVSIPVEDARWAFRRIRGVKFPRSQSEVRKFFPSAKVYWNRFGKHTEWNGKVTLVESSLDEATRALTLVVEISDPTKDWVPGKRPPLVVGMFVRVRIRGVTVPDVIVIPRAALRARDRVYLIQDGKLVIRKIEVLRKGLNEIVLKNGVSENEEMILSAIPAPVEGMRLRTTNGQAGSNASR